jgi:chromosome segregation ATPase
MDIQRMLGLAALLLAISSTAGADSSDPDARLKEMLRSTVTQLREIQDEDAALKAKQAENDAHVQDLTAQLATAKQQLADTQGKSKASEEAQQALLAAEDRAKAAEAQVTQEQSSLAKWQDAYKQAADVARQRDSDAKTLTATNSDLDRRITDCTAKNVELFNVGTDILTQYQNIDIGDLMARKEVFTQLARVKLQNAVQDYQNKLRDQKVHAPPPVVTNASATPAPPLPEPPADAHP